MRALLVRLLVSSMSIAHAAFYDCDGLTSVSLKDGLGTIGQGMFRSCDALTSIGTSAFSEAGTAFGGGAGLQGGSMTIHGARFADCSVETVAKEALGGSIGNNGIDIASS